MGDSKFSTKTLHEVNNGDPAAIEKVVNRYREQLCGLVFQEIGKRLRGRVDPESCVQSALGVFCGGNWKIDDSDKLWGLLTTITRHKMQKRIAAALADKRHPDRETPLHDDMLLSREPKPEDAVIATDLIEQVLRELQPPDPEVLRMKMEGYTREQIANHLGCTASAVRVKLDRIRARLERVLREAERSVH